MAYIYKNGKELRCIGKIKQGHQCLLRAKILFKTKPLCNRCYCNIITYGESRFFDNPSTIFTPKDKKKKDKSEVTT